MQLLRENFGKYLIISYYHIEQKLVHDVQGVRIANILQNRERLSIYGGDWTGLGKGAVIKLLSH